MNLSIKAKLGSAFGLLLFLLAGLGAFSFFSLQNINGKSSEITGVWIPSIIVSNQMQDAATSYRIGMMRYLLNPIAKYEQQMNAANKEMQAQIEEYKKMIEKAVYASAAEKQKDVDTLNSLVDKWSEATAGGSKCIALLRANQADAARNTAKTVVDPILDDIEANILAPMVSLNNDGAKRLSVESADVYDASKWMLLSTIIVALAIGLIAMLFLIRVIMQAVNELMDVSAKVGGGDLRQHASVKSGDELGQLTISYNKMIDNVKHLIQQIQNTSEQVAASSEELTASADQSAQVTQNIAKSITNVSELTSVQVGEINNASKTIETIAAGIEESTAAVQTAAEKTQDAVAIAQEGTNTIGGAVEQMNHIEETVDSLAIVVTKLGERSKEIGQIVDTISGIAGQTNLLALNAAIEAARAGEMGKGFAVVAEEVRKLAEQSQEAAKEIENLIGEIQIDTDHAVSEMDRGTQEVKTGAKVVHEAGAAFERISDVISTVNQQALEVSRTMETLAKGTQQIVSSVGSIDTSSKNVAAESQSVSAATEEQSASMEEIAASSRSLAQLAQDLTKLSNQFKI